MAMTDLRPLGTTGLEVSPLCLGGNVFGWSIDEAASFAVLDAYLAAGGNFIDTANVYSGWVPGNVGGESETIIGRWIADRGVRDRVIVATKVGMGFGQFEKGLSADQVRRGAEGCLERLGIERIDLLYAHEDDEATPLAETMSAFDELVSEGLVAAIAASNYSASRLADALKASDAAGVARFGAFQPWFNLVDRDKFDDASMAICREADLGVAPYFALARGFLAGKYRPDGPTPATPRAAGIANDYLNERGWRVLDVVDQVAAVHGATPAQVSLAWLMMHPEVTAPIASATSPEQVAELAGAASISLSDNEFAALEAAGA